LLPEYSNTDSVFYRRHPAQSGASPFLGFIAGSRQNPS
jgi:hypothetical protein